MSRIVVTGADGFIGSALVIELVIRGYDVISVVRRKPTAHLLSSSHIVSASEILDVKVPERIGMCDVWVHLAWHGTFGPDRSDPLVQIDNVNTFWKAMTSAAALNCHRFISAGSIMEIEERYDSREEDKYILRPDYNYALAKEFSKSILFSRARSLNMEGIWCVLSSVYGAGDTSSRLINYTLRSIMNGQEPSFSSAGQNYDFIYITDAVRAIISIIEDGKANSTYHLGSGKPAPLRSFLQTIQDNEAQDLVFHYGEGIVSGPDLPDRCFSIDKLHEDTGFKPEISFSEGIRMTRQWLESREA